MRTGLTQANTVLNKKTLIKYRCPKCGAEEIFVCNITSNRFAYYHELSSEKAAQNAKNKAAIKALKTMNKIDAELFKSINIDRDYEQVTFEVVCPTCGEKQIWSGIPRRWKDAKLFRFWVLGMIACLIFITTMLLNAISTPDLLPAVFTGVIYLIILSILPIIRKNKIKKALKRVKETNFAPPIYYNDSNISQLRNDVYYQQL